MSTIPAPLHRSRLVVEPLIRRDMTEPANPPPQRLYSIKTTAEVMAVSTSTVRRMIRAGTLRHIRIGDRVLVRPEFIDECIEGAS